MTTLNDVMMGTTSSVPKVVAELVAERVGKDSAIISYSLAMSEDTTTPSTWNIVVESDGAKVIVSGESDSSGWRLKGVKKC